MVVLCAVNAISEKGLCLIGMVGPPEVCGSICLDNHRSVVGHKDDVSFRNPVADYLETIFKLPYRDVLGGLPNALELWPQALQAMELCR